MRAASEVKPGQRRRAAMTGSRFQKNFWLLTMVLPGAVWLLLLRYLPMFHRTGLQKLSRLQTQYLLEQHLPKQMGRAG